MEEVLISKVREYPALYDTRCVKYRDQNVRNEAWEEIGAYLSVSATECKEVWGKLRNCFSNAIKRRRFKRGGQGGKKIAPWKYESQMDFLLPFLEGRTYAMNGGLEPADSKIGVLDEDVSCQEDADNIANLAMKDINDAPKLERPMKIPRSDDYMADMIHFHSAHSPDRFERLLHRGQTSMPEMDEVDMFYLSMAKTIKRLPKIEQAKIRMEICRVVSEAEIRQIESQGSSRPPSSASQL